MPTPTFPEAPEAPTRASPSTFVSRANAFLAWLVAFRAALVTGVAWIADQVAAIALSQTAAAASETQAALFAASAAASEAVAATGAASAVAATAAYDEFDDRYLGAKASNPTLDNDGAALLTGALYFNTGSNEMRVWTGSAWVQASAGAGYLPLAGGTMTGPLEFAAPESIASAGTTNLAAADSNVVAVTGTTTITSLGTIAAGAARWVKFAGVLTLTHHATNLILPGGANITTAAGDTALFVSEGSGNWRCLFYQRADSAPSGAWKQHASTVTISSPAASVDFTGLPPTAADLLLVVTGLSAVGGPSPFALTPQTGGSTWGSSVEFTDAIGSGSTVSATLLISGAQRTQPGVSNGFAGGFLLGGPLTGLRVSNPGGSNLDAGTVSLFYR